MRRFKQNKDSTPSMYKCNSMIWGVVNFNLLYVITTLIKNTDAFKFANDKIIEIAENSLLLSQLISTMDCIIYNHNIPCSL